MTKKILEALRTPISFLTDELSSLESAGLRRRLAWARWSRRLAEK